MIYEPGDLAYYDYSDGRWEPIILLRKIKKNKLPQEEIWQVFGCFQNNKIINRKAKYFRLINASLLM